MNNKYNIIENKTGKVIATYANYRKADLAANRLIFKGLYSGFDITVLEAV